MLPVLIEMGNPCHNQMKIDFTSPATNLAASRTQVKAQQETDSFARMLEQAKKSNDDQALKEACQQFEAYFLQQMLQGMRRTVPSSDLFEKSSARDIYEGMLDEQYSEKMAQAGGIGLAKLLYDDLTGKK